MPASGHKNSWMKSAESIGLCPLNASTYGIPQRTGVLINEVHTINDLCFNVCVGHVVTFLFQCVGFITTYLKRDLWEEWGLSGEREVMSCGHRNTYFCAMCFRVHVPAKDYKYKQCRFC